MQSSNTRGGALVGILIGLMAVVGVALVIAVGAGMYVSRHVTVRESRGRTTIETPFGSVQLREGGRFDPAHFGVPVYPGAARQEDSRKLASFELDLGDTHKEFSIVAAEYTTADSVDEVTAFYRDRLPHWMFSSRCRGNAQFEFTEDGYKRIVAIRQQHGRTHIGLASVGGPASN
ncbi:MAG TPA: hypothetical protein VN442_19160 [Bryobacteraceae bacterium]|nr:hypothetical protein [Bryobacteraceae bacterium]